MNYSESADQAKKVVVGIEVKVGKALAIQADMSKADDAGHNIHAGGVVM